MSKQKILKLLNDIEKQEQEEKERSESIVVRNEMTVDDEWNIFTNAGGNISDESISDFVAKYPHHSHAYSAFNDLVRHTLNVRVDATNGSSKSLNTNRDPLSDKDIDELILLYTHLFNFHFRCDPRYKKFAYNDEYWDMDVEEGRADLKIVNSMTCDMGYASFFSRMRGRDNRSILTGQSDSQPLVEDYYFDQMLKEIEKDEEFSFPSDPALDDIKPNSTNLSIFGNRLYRIKAENAVHPISIHPKNKAFNQIRRLAHLNLLNDNVWLAGGSIRSCLEGKTPNDLDVFCKTEQDFLETCGKLIGMKGNFKLKFLGATKDNFDYLYKNTGLVSGGFIRRTVKDEMTSDQQKRVAGILGKLRRHDPKELPANKEKFRLATFEADNILFDDMKIQVIYRPDIDHVVSLLDDFDFTICQAAFDGEYFYFTSDFITAFDSKFLILGTGKNKIKYPVAALRRISKYGMYGYRLSADEAGRVFQQINQKEFDPENLSGYIM